MEPFVTLTGIAAPSGVVMNSIGVAIGHLGGRVSQEWLGIADRIGQFLESAKPLRGSGMKARTRATKALGSSTG